MRAVLEAVHQVAEHPWTNPAVAAILIGSSLMEAGDSLVDSALSGEFGSHHGVFILGIAQAVKSLPEVVDGIERLFHRDARPDDG